MRESRSYGSVRGALSNGRPYRDRHFPTERTLYDNRHWPLARGHEAVVRYAGFDEDIMYRALEDLISRYLVTIDDRNY